MAARSRDARYFCGPARCLVKRDGQNPVRSLPPLGPPSFGGIRDRQRPKRVRLGSDSRSASCPLSLSSGSGHVSLPSDVGFVPIVSQKSAERTRGAMFVLAPVPLWIFLAM
jgi:hypothetical protein